MAISHRAAGAYVSGISNLTPVIPASAVAGDIMLCFWGSKPYDSTASIDNGWTKIGEKTNGTVAPNVDTGSMKIIAWYKVHTGSENNPTITSNDNAVSGAVINVFKNDSNNWETPVGSGGGDSVDTLAYSALMASNVGFTAGDMMVGYAAMNSDAATQSGISITAPGMTNGTFAEKPNTDLTTTAGSDMAMSGGQASVISGTATGAPTYAATLAASKSGVAFVVRLRERQTISLTPGVGAATYTGNAPAISQSGPQTVSPAVGIGTYTGFAPNSAAEGTPQISISNGIATASYTPLPSELSKPPLIHSVELLASVSVRIGAILTAVITGEVSGPYGVGSHEYQWYRTNSTQGGTLTAINGATGVEYVIQAADVNNYIICRAKFAQDGGVNNLSSPMYSEMTDQVSPNVIVHTNTGEPVYTGLVASIILPISAGIGSGQYAGVVPVVNTKINASVGLGIYDGIQPSISINLKVSVGLGLAQFVGLSPNVFPLLIDTGAVTLIGLAPSVNVKVNGDLAQLLASGFAPQVLNILIIGGKPLQIDNRIDTKSLCESQFIVTEDSLLTAIATGQEAPVIIYRADTILISADNDILRADYSK